MKTISSITRLIVALIPLLASNAPAQTTAPAKTPAGYVIGVLQATPAHIATDYKAGVRLATLEVAWSSFEPGPDQVDDRYAADIKARLALFRAAHMLVQLDLGIQYPPQWIKDLPNARYINQYGTAYIDRTPGKDVVNPVFNQLIRDREADYVARVFHVLGPDFYAVRLGWQYFGELGYPGAGFEGKENCYWGYDALAQGNNREFLPPGIGPCPVPGWIPGTPSTGHLSAKRFAEWYLSALANCQAWEIQTVRHYYQGKLPVLYGSWGIRAGVADKEIAADLGDKQQTEMQRGYDLDRLVTSIADPNVLPYTTWIDSNPSFGDDTKPDAKRWCPAHYLADRAASHPLKLTVWGENTGRGDGAALELSLRRMRDYRLLGLVWAFEGDLYESSHKYASILDMDRAVKSLTND